MDDDGANSNITQVASINALCRALGHHYLNPFGLTIFCSIGPPSTRQEDRAGRVVEKAIRHAAEYSFAQTHMVVSAENHEV